MLPNTCIKGDIVIKLVAVKPFDLHSGARSLTRWGNLQAEVTYKQIAATSRAVFLFKKKTGFGKKEQWPNPENDDNEKVTSKVGCDYFYWRNKS